MCYILLAHRWLHLPWLSHFPAHGGPWVMLFGNANDITCILSTITLQQCRYNAAFIWSWDFYILCYQHALSETSEDLQCILRLGIRIHQCVPNKPNHKLLADGTILGTGSDANNIDELRLLHRSHGVRTSQSTIWMSHSIHLEHGDRSMAGPWLWWTQGNARIV